jgi:omega-amidase
MRAHLVQLDIQWESAHANFDRVRQLIEHANPNAGDLIALPELFDSGFTLNTSLSCDTDSSTLSFLQQLARDTGCFIQGSRSIMPENGTLAYNCATVLSPEQQEPLCEYYKIHPFSMGFEPKAYQGGSAITSYTWGVDEFELQACPLICYDLRFPELFRKAAVNGAEVFVLGANWPHPRQHHWRALLIARAIENQAFVFGINRCGDDPNLHYAGGTIAVDPKGEILGELGDEEAVLSVEVDPKALRDWRRKFRVLDDIKIRSF